MNAASADLKYYAEFHRNTECLPDIIVQQLIADVPLEPFEKYIDTIMEILEPSLEKSRDYTHQLWMDAQKIAALKSGKHFDTEQLNSEHIPLTPNHSPYPSPSPQEESSDFSWWRGCVFI